MVVKLITKLYMLLCSLDQLNSDKYSKSVDNGN